MTRLIFINRFFYPDQSATAMMLTDLVCSLESHFDDIHVVTSGASYTGDLGDTDVEAKAPKAVVHKAPALASHGSGLLKRIINYLAFFAATTIVLLKIARGDAIVICLSDPPLIGVIVQRLCGWRRMRCIHWHQDIFPETAMELGVLNARSWLTHALVELRNRSTLGGDQHVAIGERMGARLVKLGVPEARVSLIPNWSDETAIVPIPAEDNPLRHQWGFHADHCVIGYSGNLGRAHDVETLASAIMTMAKRGERDVRFLFIGAGAGLERLKVLIHEVPDWLVQFRPYQPRGILSQSLCVPDIHFATLQPELEGLIVPSKIYGIFASGRPLLFVGSATGEVAGILSRHQCGSCVEPGESAELCDKIVARAEDPRLRAFEGAQARKLVEEELSRQNQLSDWRACIESQVGL